MGGGHRSRAPSQASSARSASVGASGSSRSPPPSVQRIRPGEVTPELRLQQGVHRPAGVASPDTHWKYHVSRYTASGADGWDPKKSSSMYWRKNLDAQTTSHAAKPTLSRSAATPGTFGGGK